MGRYDGLIPQPALKGIDFICFTDQPSKSKSWNIVHCPAKTTDCNRNAKEFKILPHKFLPEYDVSIWIDGNFLVRHTPKELLDLLWETPIAAFHHGHDCIYSEFKGLLDHGRKSGRYKDDPKTMRLQIERYFQEGFPTHFGLTQNGVIIRRHHDPLVVKTMEHWWREIQIGSKRDQLSLFYSLWKTSLPIKILPFDSRDCQWFYMLGVHRSNYTYKYIRYRIKRIFGLERSYKI